MVKNKHNVNEKQMKDIERVWIRDIWKSIAMHRRVWNSKYMLNEKN